MSENTQENTQETPHPALALVQPAASPTQATNLTPFQFETHNVRVIKDHLGEPWFNANDVCAALELANPRDALTKHVDSDDVAKRDIIDSLGRPQSANFVNESGLYALIFGSTKESARKFKKWVTSEVLPSIRKTGSYAPKTFAEALRLAADLEEQKMLAEQQRDLAIATKSLIGHRREATAMNTASQAVKQVTKLQIELDQSKRYATVKRMEMLYHGQKFDWRLLKSTANQMELPPISVFDANYGTVNSYHADVWQEAYALGIPDVSDHSA